MYVPWDPQIQLLEKVIWQVINGNDFQGQMNQKIRLEVEKSKARYYKENNSNNLSYDMLTQGNVNLQAKMAASGLDVYGRTIIPGNQATKTNNNIYQKMKNKINYGSNPANSFQNNGQRSFAEGGANP